MSKKRDRLGEMLGAMSRQRVEDVHEFDNLLEINVVCSDTKWHPTTNKNGDPVPPFTVAVFAQNEPGAPHHWRIKDELQEGTRKAPYRTFSGEETLVDVAVPVSDKERHRSTQTDSGVWLVCPKHPFDVLRRWDKLDPFLDGLLHAGVLSISLQGLAARVRK